MVSQESNLLTNYLWLTWSHRVVDGIGNFDYDAHIHICNPVYILINQEKNSTIILQLGAG